MMSPTSFVTAAWVSGETAGAVWAKVQAGRRTAVMSGRMRRIAERYHIGEGLGPGGRWREEHATAKANAGPLHCATDDETVHHYGRDDASLLADQILIKGGGGGRGLC